MPTVKKLRLILSDTEQLMSELEQRHRNIRLRFTCYRNGQSAYQSNPIKGGQLTSVLPDACRKHRASEIDLIITGTNQKLETAELYKERFVLATKDHHNSNYSNNYNSNNRHGNNNLVHNHVQSHSQHHNNNNLPILYQSNGLGGYNDYTASLPQVYTGGLAGLGALPPETVLMAQHMAGELRFRDEHNRLQEEANGLREKVKEQQQQIDFLEARLDSRSNMLNIANSIKMVAPALSAFVGTDSKVGQALAGLGNADTSHLQSSDDPLTASAVEMLREFMATLQPQHQNKLVWVMQNVREDHELITSLAAFIEQRKRARQGGQVPQPQPNQRSQHGQVQGQGQRQAQQQPQVQGQNVQRKEQSQPQNQQHQPSNQE